MYKRQSRNSIYNSSNPNEKRETAFAQQGIYQTIEEKRILSNTLDDLRQDKQP